MADDMFGDAALFDEFDKEREPSGSFILYEKDGEGEEDRSTILFQFSDSSSSDDDDESNDVDKLKVAESVVRAVENPQAKDGKCSSEATGNGLGENGVDESSSDSEDGSIDEPVVSKERLAKSTSYKLNFERNKFKRYCNIIDSTRYIHDVESPAVQIIFQNNNFSRKYKTQIESFLKNLLDIEAKTEYETFQKLDLKNSTPSCTELNDKVPISKRTDQMWRAHAIIGCTQFFQGFVLDALGWPLVEYNPSLTESWDIPIYEQLFEDILPVDVVQIKANAAAAKKERAKPKCWNCDGEHMLSECKVPRNQQKINENRKAMMADKAAQHPSGPKSERYHKETSDDQKFSKFKPGHISQELRDALGLGDHQLPFYIYQMRALGYPPGWMEEAKQAPGLSMFNKDGIDMEEEDQATQAPMIDVEKIIEYPGFTLETPPHFVDEAAQYGLPPLQPHQLKAVLREQTRMQQEALKRVHGEDEEQERKRMKLEASDMDLDETQMSAPSISFNPPLPPDTPPSRPPPPDSTPPPTPRESPLPGKASRESSEARSDSPSLEELEAKYQLLQQSLQDSGEEGEVVSVDSGGEDDSQSSLAPGDNTANPIEVDSQEENSFVENTSKNPIQITDDSVVEDQEEEYEFLKPKLNRIGSTSSIQTFGELGIGSPVNSLPGTPIVTSSTDNKPQFSASKSVSRDFGTPIHKRHGSKEFLPADSKFAEGIEDHIPFENLPDSTGTFEKMRNLIDKIRKKIPSKKKK